MDKPYGGENTIKAIIKNVKNLFASKNHTHDDVYETIENAQAKLDEANDYTDIKILAEANTRETGDADTLSSAKTYTDESVVTYSLSKTGTTITLSGTDDSSSSVEENTTIASDDNAGNVVLESADSIANVDDAIKQEIIDATIASLNTETLTFTLDDGTTVTKEVVVK